MLNLAKFPADFRVVLKNVLRIFKIAARGQTANKSVFVDTESPANTQRYSHTAPKTLTSTGSSQGSVSTDDSLPSSEVVSAILPLRKKQPPKVPPKPKGGTLRRRNTQEEAIKVELGQVNIIICFVSQFLGL